MVSQSGFSDLAQEECVHFLIFMTPPDCSGSPRGGPAERSEPGSAAPTRGYERKAGSVPKGRRPLTFLPAKNSAYTQSFTGHLNLTQLQEPLVG